MSFRIRAAQQQALAQSHVGNFLADLARPFAKAAHYDPSHQCVRVTGHRNQEAQIHLDGQGNILRLVTPLGRETRYLYERGKQVGAQLPTGLTIRTRYDAEGRVVVTKRDDGARDELGHDATGNVAAFRSADGATLQLLYGSHGQVEGIRERDGAEIHRAYDERGSLTNVIDPLGRETTFEYGL